MPRFDVTTIGEGQLRYSVPAGIRLEEAEQLDLHVAGTEANVTGLLARLGWSCGWVSSLPKTPMGRRVYNRFYQSGLDLSAVAWSDSHRLATYYVEYAEPPRSTQVYYDRADTCFTNMRPEQIDWDYLLDTRLLHLSGLTAPLSSSILSIMTEAVERAEQADVAVSFDMNYRSHLWSPQEAAATVGPLLEKVDLLFFGRGDAKIVFGIDGTPQGIVEQLGQRTKASYIITSMADDGIIGWDRHRFYTEPARDVVIIDRIGAGDGMVAGVIDGWLQEDFPLGLRTGALTAALALSQHGDQVVTNREEVTMLLESTSAGITR
ncbi:MAG: sugar kinase [Chloroflexota bacterium]